MPGQTPSPNNPGSWQPGGPNPGGRRPHQGGAAGWHYEHGRYGSSWSASLHYLNSGFGGQLIAVLVIASVAMAAALAVRRRTGWFFGLSPASTCLALGSLAAIAVATLTPRSNAWGAGTVQLIPLHTVRSYLHQPADLLIYLGGNVALFLPLGFFSYLALSRRAIRHRILVSATAGTLVSVCVELLQLNIWSRSSDVDDVLTNGLGALAGALAGAVALRFLAWRRPALQEPPATPVYAVGSRAS